MSEPWLPDTASIIDFAACPAAAAATKPGSPQPPAAAVAAPGSAELGNRRRRLIGWLDRLLRRLQGIAEFSGEPDCLLRVARTRAGAELRLADGCRIGRGSEVLDLHLWNEHLSGLPSPRRGLARASALRRCIVASLHELAGRVETDPSFGQVAALRARTAFVPRRRLRKVLRIARAFGFDAIAPAPFGPRPGALLTLWEDLLLWALAWTFNPSTLRRNGVLREHCDLWISRGGFVARYGEAASSAGSISRGGAVHPGASPTAGASPSLVSARPVGSSSREGRISP